MVTMTRFLLAVCAIALLAGGRPSGQSPDPKKRFKIDAHYHYQNDPQFLERTLKNAREYNLMVVLLAPYDALARVQEAAKQHPDVIIPFGSVSLDDPQALEKIDAFHKARFKGVGEITRPLVDFDSPRYFLFYERLARHGMVALFHTGIVSRGNPDVPQQSGMARMRPAFIDSIARRFTHLRIIGAHLGNPWYEEAAEGLRWHPNLVYDLTGSSLLKKADDPKYWGRVLWWRPTLATPHSPGGGHAFERIVFGTDEGPGGLAANIERFQAVLDANNISEDVREKCWGGTLAKWLGVSPRR